MRIIGGKYKRKLLVSPVGKETTRPTSDRVKENLFNILAPEISGAIVLDLFAGSGALGIEALSRGAIQCAFVEQSKETSQYLRKNLSNCKLEPEQFLVSEKNVSEFLGICARKESLHFPKNFLENFAASTNIIFADPPYASGWYNEALEQIETSGLCAPGALLVIEMAASREPLPNATGNWTLEDTRKYGHTRLEFWRRTTE